MMAGSAYAESLNLQLPSAPGSYQSDKFKSGQIVDGHAHPMWNEFGIMPHEEFTKVKLTELHNSKTFNTIFNKEGNI